MGALDMFKKEIGLDFNTNTVAIEEYSLLIEYSEDPDTSTTKTSWWTGGGSSNYHITMVHYHTKSVRELMFEFYSLIGEILKTLGSFDTKEETEWLKKSTLVTELIDLDKLAMRLRIDKYAFSKIGYRGQIGKLIVIPRYSKETPEKLIDKIRRRHLDYLASVNETSSFKPKKELGNAEWQALSNVPKKPSYDNHAYERSFKTETKHRNIFIETPMHEFMRRAHITYNSKDTFQLLCQKCISAVTGTLNKQNFDIGTTEFVPVKEKPKNWKEEYKSYYYYDTQAFTYKQIPENTRFEDTDVYQIRKATDKAVDIKNKYTALVEKFLIPKYKEYVNLVSLKDRKEIEYVVGTAMLESIDGYSVPSPIRLKVLADEYKGVPTFGGGVIIDINKRTNQKEILYSYNDKIRLAKEKNPKGDNETEQLYMLRIKKIVDLGLWQ